MVKPNQKPVVENITKYNSVLLGLVGHVDSGKTAIARMISEIISTSGLDAHPQSKKRGITIDLGFTSLILDNNLITLVDAPGHADLIRSVVASANIIEGAILVIDSSKGMQIQTAEHLVILESLGIPHLLVVLNKIDLVDKERINELTEKVKNTIATSEFSPDYEIIEVSAKYSEGKDALVSSIGKLVGNIVSERALENDNKGKEQADLIYPIDHHFKIKGQGIIVTGTTISGLIKRNQEAMIIPQKKKVKIKSLQIYHQEVEKAPQGFRVGARIAGIDVETMARGNVITDNPSLFKKTSIVKIKWQLNNYYKRDIHFGSQINITFGLNTENARIFPFIHKEGHDLMIAHVNHENYLQYKDNLYAYIWLLEPNFLQNESKILMSQLDLPPTTLRFFGTGSITELEVDEAPDLYYYKIKKGSVRNSDYGKREILVESLAESKEGAITLIGKKLTEPRGTIKATFGNKGVVVVEIAQSQENVKNGDPAELKIVRKTKIDKNRAY